CGRKQSVDYLGGVAPDGHGLVGLGLGDISVPSILAKCAVRVWRLCRGIEIFRRDNGQRNWVRVDDFTFASALASCAGIASIRLGKLIHAHIVVRTRLNLDVGVDENTGSHARCSDRLQAAWQYYSWSMGRSPAFGDSICYQFTSSPIKNLYALCGKSDGVADARKMLNGVGLKKETGYSLNEVKGI
ncbi:hypothetical protein IFM89_023293, partial [Coptis chinensis]